LQSEDPAVIEESLVKIRSSHKPPPVTPVAAVTKTPSKKRAREEVDPVDLPVAPAPVAASASSVVSVTIPDGISPEMRDGYLAAAAIVSSSHGDSSGERSVALASLLAYRKEGISALAGTSRLPTALSFSAGVLSGLAEVDSRQLPASGAKVLPGVSLFLAGREHVPDILRLIRELAEYEKEPHAVKITEETLIRDGFSDSPVFHVVLARVDGHVVGMAFCYHAYSTWEGRVLYLEDLYVSPAQRGRGVGTLLLNCLAKAAFLSDCARLVWQVLDW
jgi:GNAT superfamily N-acetyltransferase